MQPGETITPGTPPTPEQQPEQAEIPPQAPTPVIEQPIPAPDPIPPADPASTWQYTDDETMNTAIPAEPQINPVSWTASEYIAHNKGTAWFAAFGLILFVVVAAVYFVTKGYMAPAVVAVAGISFGAFAARSPRVLEYSLDSRGIKIDQKFYPYAEFKSFDIVDEGQFPAIMLSPLKRFLPPLTVFYDQQEEDAILGVLSSYLPHQEQQPDPIDRLMRHIRF